MDIFYINLDSEPTRRHALEENFRRVATPGWSLTRVEAITSQEMAGKIPGRIGNGEKACFHSHIKALGLAKQSPGPVLIAEDDIRFGQRSFAAIEETLQKIPESNWDIIFADISVTNIHAMTDLLLMRRQATNGASFGLVNLARMPFAGSVSYIVNRHSKDKLLSLITAPGPLDYAYDIHLQRAIAAGQLRGFVTFPFATTLSSDAENSQIHNPRLDEAATNAFRRLMWLERDIGEAERTIARATNGSGDAETETFLKILSVFLSPAFKQ